MQKLPKTYLYSYNLTLLLLNSKELQAVTKISASTIIISQTRIFHPNCRALPNMSAITAFQMAAGSWTLLMHLEKNISVWHQLAAVPWVSSSSGCFTLDLCFCRDSRCNSSSHQQEPSMTFQLKVEVRRGKQVLIFLSLFVSDVRTEFDKQSEFAAYQRGCFPPLQSHCLRFFFYIRCVFTLKCCVVQHQSEFISGFTLTSSSADCCTTWWGLDFQEIVIWDSWGHVPWMLTLLCIYISSTQKQVKQSDYQSRSVQRQCSLAQLFFLVSGRHRIHQIQIAFYWISPVFPVSRWISSFWKESLTNEDKNLPNSY